MLLHVIIEIRTNSSDFMKKEEPNEDDSKDSKKGRKWPIAIRSSSVTFFVYK